MAKITTLFLLMVLLNVSIAKNKTTTKIVSKTIVNVTVIDQLTLETVPLAGVVFKAEDGVCSVLNANADGVATSTELLEGNYEIMAFANGYLQTESKLGKIKQNKINNFTLQISSVYEPKIIPKKSSKVISTEF